MLICSECGILFEQAKIIYEHHGLDDPPFEVLYVCPCCEGTNIHLARRCDLCGEWITGSYIVTTDGNHICDDCFTKCDVEND